MYLLLTVGEQILQIVFLPRVYNWAGIRSNFRFWEDNDFIAI